MMTMSRGGKGVEEEEEVGGDADSLSNNSSNERMTKQR